MTCILAIRHRAGVLVACDSVVSGDNMRATDSRKVRRAHGVFLGASGHGRLCELALGVRCAPYRGGSLRDWSERHYAPAVWAAAKAEPGDELELCVLLAVHDQIACLDDDGSTYDPLCPDLHAIGSGAEYALGSLASSSGAPKARATLALEIAARYGDGIGPPWRFVSA
jgi:ATP-dependent protease HslVU (ClpYQ) peptidase subunit